MGSGVSPHHAHLAWGRRRLRGRYLGQWAAAGMPGPLLLTGLSEDVGSGTYTGVCKLELDSVLEPFPLSRRNLDFTHPILLDREKGAQIVQSPMQAGSPLP